MSRPLAMPKLKPVLETPKPVAAQGPADQALAEQAAAVSREASGIAGGDVKGGVQVGPDQGKMVEIVGPDGVKRRVRIIDPAL